LLTARRTSHILSPPAAAGLLDSTKFIRWGGWLHSIKWNPNPNPFIIWPST
jgi:hypothetical protein